MAKEQTIAGQNEEIQTRGVCAGCQRPQETEPRLVHAGGHAGPRANRAVSLDGRGPPPRPPARGVCGRGRELTALFVTVAGCETGPVTLAMS